MRFPYVVLCVLALGCGKKTEDAGAPVKIDCASVIPPTVDRMIAAFKQNPAAASGEGAKLVDETGPRLSSALLAQCETQKYSTDYLGCLAAVKTPPDMEKCDAKMTPAQQKSSEKVVGEAMKPLIEWLQAEAAKQGVKTP
jgi:hypothetical protein